MKTILPTKITNFSKNCMNGALLFLLLFCLSFFIFPEKTQATEMINQALEVTKIDNSKTNAQLSYFEIETAPGDKQTLEVEVKNISDKKITITQSVLSAWTGENAAQIEYTKNEDDYDSSLQYKMNEYIVINGGSTLQLEAGESKKVTATMNIPDDMPLGEALGAWIFSFEEENSVNKDISNHVLGINLFIGKEQTENQLALTDLFYADGYN